MEWIIFWGYFPWYFFKDENFETCLDFYFWALETFFLTLKIRKNNQEIANLEFESHGFLNKHACLATEQAGTNIC